MKIVKTSDSRISSIDFSNLPFGRIFSDHMLECHYKGEEWLEPIIKPYGPISMYPGTQVLHYGQSIFEGMKVFKNRDDELLFFRPKENFKRLNRSAIRLSIPEIPEEIFFNGMKELLRLDHVWCKAEDGYSLYVRPFIYSSSEWIKASAGDEFTFMIITTPTINYYTGAIDLVIEQNFSRATRGGVGHIKAAGNYAASFYPTKIANSKGFTQVIWTDSKEHKYIEESGTMNIWFRIGDKLITPSLSDSILSGVTRDSILELAIDEGIEVEERDISVSEIVEASNNNLLLEAFGTGTAVSVVAVQSITLNNDKMFIPQQLNPYSMLLKKRLQDIQYGRVDDNFNWTIKI